MKITNILFYIITLPLAPLWIFFLIKNKEIENEYNK